MIRETLVISFPPASSSSLCTAMRQNFRVPRTIVLVRVVGGEKGLKETAHGVFVKWCTSSLDESARGCEWIWAIPMILPGWSVKDFEVIARLGMK